MSELHLCRGDDGQRRNGAAKAFAQDAAKAFAHDDEQHDTPQGEDHEGSDTDTDTDGTEAPTAPARKPRSRARSFGRVHLGAGALTVAANGAAHVRAPIDCAHRPPR